MNRVFGEGFANRTVGLFSLDPFVTGFKSMNGTLKAEVKMYTFFRKKDNEIEKKKRARRNERKKEYLGEDFNKQTNNHLMECKTGNN